MRLILAGLVLSGLALLSARHIPIWSSPGTLWTKVVLEAPGDPRPLINLAAVHITEGRLTLARYELRRAARQARAHPAAIRVISNDLIQANLGALYIRQGRFDRACAVLRDESAGSSAGTVRQSLAQQWGVCD